MRSGTAPAVILIALGVLVAAGCGSSKPEFCSKTDDLQDALTTLKSNVTSGNFSEVQSDAQTVKADVNAVASSAKSDFPSETSAVQSSVTTLSAAIQGLPPSPSPDDLVRLASDITAVALDVDNFKTATSSKCD
jgi:hypothetical protein